MDSAPALRVAILHFSLKVQGGAEQLIVSLARGLAQRGHTVTLFTRDYDESLWGIPLTLGFGVQKVFAPNDYWDAASFRDWETTGRRLAPHLAGFDVIVANVFPTMLWWHHAREADPSLRSIPALWYCHGFVGWFNPGVSETHAVASTLDANYGQRGSMVKKAIGRLRSDGPLWVARKVARQLFTPALSERADRLRDLEREIVPQFDRVLANSRFTGENVRTAFGVDAVTCYPGITLGDGSEPDGSGGDSVLTLSRLDASKNVLALLRAVALLRDDGIVPFTSCLIAGSGPGEADLRAFCAENKLDSLVQFVGPVSGVEKERLYGRAALFVLPCLDEGFGLVFVEAADHCVASIGPDHGGPAEIIVPGTTGWLVDPLDPAALASWILEAFSDRERLAAFGVAARERADDLFSVDAFVDRFEQSLITTAGSRGSQEAGSPS